MTRMSAATRLTVTYYCDSEDLRHECYRIMTIRGDKARW